MAVTIHDVAKRAGVSVGSVSRHINGHLLKEKNRNAIEQAIAELGFKENLIAKGLKRNRTMTIGVLIGSLTDIFSTSIVTSMEKIMETENYSLIICDYEGQNDKFSNKLEFLRARFIDGLVVFPGAGRDDLLKVVNDWNIPTVVINDDIKGIQIDRVLVDNANASFRATEKLIHMGHRKIAVINGSKDSYASVERFKGYLEAIKLYDIQINDKYIKYGDFNNKGGYYACLELLNLEEPPTAIYVTNYYMTLGAMMAINKKGITVPDKLSVIGFDRFDFMDFFKPVLTVVEQPTSEIGETAAYLLLKRLKGDYSDFPSKIMLNTRMVMGDSVIENKD